MLTAPLETSNSINNNDSGINITNLQRRGVTMNDNVHTYISLPSLCARIIDTPQFQRLRNMKQLGFSYFVYPSGSHNRFEHCIGTAYLAGEYCRILQRNQGLGIDEKDILCLQIAGLCHDLGHGPFSHSWEHFMRRYDQDYSHEKMSIRMLDYLIKDNDLWEYFKSDGLEEKDLDFIKELILGHPLPDEQDFIGRPSKKFFLYQIVSNEDTKIDVDKFDYLLRDSKQLNVSTSFDYRRLIDNSYVMNVKASQGKDLMKITYRKKIAPCLEELFKARFQMHEIAYQHRVTMIIEDMVIDALHAAEPFFEVLSDDGTSYKLSTACRDLSAFIKLTDIVLELMLNWSKPEASSAKEILQRVMKRDLYKSLGYTTEKPKDHILNELLKDTHNTLKLIPTCISYGKGAENPLNNAYFHEKIQPNSSFRLEFLPAPVKEKYYIVFKPSTQDIKNSSPITSLVDLEIAKNKIKKWADEHGIVIQHE